MRSQFQRRPQVEGLETKALLSGGMHHAIAAQVTTSPIAGFVALNGTTRGVFLEHQSNPDTGRHDQLFTSGRLSPVGPASVNGGLSFPGFVANPVATGTLHVLAPRGTLNLQLTQVVVTPPTASNEFVFSYTITGGSRAYRNAFGSGTVGVTLSAVNSGVFRVGRARLDFFSVPPPATV